MSAFRRPFGRREFLAAFALLVCLGGAAATAAPRIVAVGDVHGDLVGFKAILVEAGVLDRKGAWAGGDTVFVQVGDLIDRGAVSRGVLDFMMALGPEAARRGGTVVSLLGNHEVMNLTGDLRYVVAPNYAEFADADSGRRVEEAWKQVVALRQRRARALGQPEPAVGADEKDAWMKAHPPGYLERQAALGPDGVYGRWIRQRPAVFRAQGTAFLHGGLSPAYAKTSLEELDRRVHEDIAAFDADRKLFVERGLILPFFNLPETTQAVRDELAALDAAAAQSAEDVAFRKAAERFLDWGSWTINSPEGPLWFRGYSQWSDDEGDFEMPSLLDAARVERFVVGHSVPTDGRIRVRFGGAVFLIDSGMLGAPYFPGGRASALELSNGVATAIYVGEGRRAIWPEPAKKVAAVRWSERGAAA